MRHARTALAAAAISGVLAVGLAVSPAHAQPQDSRPTRVMNAQALAPTIQITDASFTRDVLNSQKPVLVNFCAEWSSVCRTLRPILEQVATERTGRVTVGTLDIDQNPVTPPRYDINAVPSLLLFKGGRVVATRIGPATKRDVLALIDPHL
jgi:thioredoxin 1